MRSVRRPDEYADLLARAAADRTEHALTGRRALALRDEILMPDRQSPELGNVVPLEFIDDTLAFNPKWVIDKIAPRPVLFITSDDDRLVPPQETEAMYACARGAKKLVVLNGFGHYEFLLSVASGDGQSGGLVLRLSARAGQRANMIDCLAVRQESELLTGPGGHCSTSRYRQAQRAASRVNRGFFLWRLI